MSEPGEGEVAMDELFERFPWLEEAAARREDVTLFGVDYEVCGIGDGSVFYAVGDGEWAWAAYNRHHPKNLKPCPLCGGEAEYLHVGGIRHPWSGVQADELAVTVQCSRCGCTIPSDRDQARVTELWNGRVS